MGEQTRRIGTPEHFQWLRGIVQIVIVLNVLDAILTILWVYSGKATEANPLMAGLIDNPVLFVSCKLALVGLGTFLLWRLRKQRFAVVGIFFGFIVYYFVLLYHLQSMNLRLLRRFID